MGYELSKKFRFESAHRLAKGYKGKCANIHGHSWNGELTIIVQTLDEYGFALDFGKLGEFNKRIEKLLDHTIFLYEKDTDIIKLCRGNKWTFWTFSENPTSEVIAQWIFDKARMHFDCDVHILSVTIQETCTSECKYTG